MSTVAPLGGKEVAMRFDRKVVCFVLGFALLSFGGAAAGKDADPNKDSAQLALFPTYVSTSEEPLHIKLDGVDYLIPHNTFDVFPKVGKENDGLSLDVLHPGLQGRTEDNWRTFDDVRNPNRLSILVTAVTRRNFRGLELVERRRKIYMEDEADMQRLTDRFGLEYYELPQAILEEDKRRRRFTRWYSHYVDRDKHGRPLTYIRCSIKVGSTINPNCIQFFGEERVIFKVRYLLARLQDWRQIQEDVLRRFALWRQAAREAGFGASAISDRPGETTD
ncbi:MAG: hypothetical protein QNJ84_03295 [Alphaproteobacteria bacterium]|nr:hypothetical protein [Alphaproteobacteria bacterium]